MKLEINIDKKHLLIILAVIIVIAGTFGVIAALGDPAPNPGHHSSELAGFPDCGSNKYLKHNNGVWSCVTDQVGAGGGGDITNVRVLAYSFCETDGDPNEQCPANWIETFRDGPFTVSVDICDASRKVVVVTCVQEA